ncbi:MAG: reverse transcriptase domain-containing protein [Rhodanobacter sp.]
MDAMHLERLHRFKFITTGQFFAGLFSLDCLYESFRTRYSRSSAKGLDRVSGSQYKKDAIRELEIASHKCRNGTFKFTPYLEVLKPKGRNKHPRIIGIPTVRDRVILGHLHIFLAAIFPEAVPRQISGAYVRNIAEGLAKAPPGTWICGTDIKTFYDSIQRERLIDIVGKRITIPSATILIERALNTPIVPKNTPGSRRKEFAEEKGVPQGLAISNILASIYMHPIDEPMNGMGVSYVRYVDDVLMYGTEQQVKVAHKSLAARLRRRGLSLHGLSSSKTQIQEITKPFDFLGYKFLIPKVTVRESTIERFLQASAAKFSEFKHSKPIKLSKYKYLNEDRLKEIFILELNEKITGAISDERRYGWIAYFSQINDHTLLYRIDTIIANMFSRLREFDYKSPPGLKKLSRAYWEMKFRPEGGYIRNYDKIQTIPEKLEFLITRGRLGPNDILTDEQIDDRYQAYVKVVLADMYADEGSIY